MIGRDFKKVGSERNILTRFGNGSGYPYQGPVKIKFLSKKTLAVIDCGKSIHLQNVNGTIDMTISPLSIKPPEHIPTADDSEIVDQENWHASYLERHSKSTTQDINEKKSVIEVPIKYAAIGANDVCVIPRTGRIIVGDTTNTLKFVNQYDYEVEIDSVGKPGSAQGEFSFITGVDCFKLGHEWIFCICEAGLNQRIQLINEDGQVQLVYGEFGPAIGQFRDPASVSCMISADIVADSVHEAITPAWYKGVCSRHVLEDYLYENERAGNFFVGMRADDPSVHDLVYWSDNLECVRLVMKWSAQAVGENGVVVPPGVSLSSTLGSGQKRYDSISSLVKSMHHLKKPRESRPSVLLAVADRGNFRVQVFRYYWTRSDVYVPGIEILHVVGGSKQLFFDLIDPVSVSYSRSGELAICDRGAKRVLVLSEHMDLVKNITTPFTTGMPIHVRGPALALSSFVSSKYGDATVVISEFDGKDFVPTSSSFCEDGKLAVGYKCGVGTLNGLQESALTTALDYCDYDAIRALRDTCRYLHNFTRRLRAVWRIHPLRAHKYDVALFAFIKWSRWSSGEHASSDFLPLFDNKNNELCCKHLQETCSDKYCVQSHAPANVNTEERNKIPAYLSYDSLALIVAQLFGSAYVWQCELFMQELFTFFGVVESMVVLEEGARKRPQTCLRSVNSEPRRVLRMAGYLELMTVLEEDHSGAKLLATHELFNKSPRQHQSNRDPYDLEHLPDRLHVDLLKQYDNGINVPHLKPKARLYLTVEGMTDARRGQDSSAKQVHIQTFKDQSDRAASMINNLFS